MGANLSILQMEALRYQSGLPPLGVLAPCAVYFSPLCHSLLINLGQIFLACLNLSSFPLSFNESTNACIDILTKVGLEG